MKMICKIITISAMLIVSTVSAQGPEQLHLSNPFAKKNWNFRYDRILSYEHATQLQDGVKIGKQTDASLDLLAMYFLTSGFGVGLNYTADWFCNENYSTTNWVVSPGVMYGTHLGRNNHIYGRVDYGMGIDKQIQIIPGANNNLENKWDVSRLTVAVGSPFNLNTGTCYISPEIFWRRNRTDYHDGHKTESNLGLNLTLQTYIAPPEFQCDSKLDYSAIHRRYDQGSSFIDFSTKGGFSFGNSETKFDQFPNNTFKEDFSQGDFSLKYGHYFFDNIAIGAGLEYNGSSQKLKDPDHKTTFSSWSFSPEISFNLPAKNAWNNLFLDLEGRYGQQKTEITLPSNTHKSKDNISGFGICLGYNHGIAKDVALTPRIGYDWNTVKNSDTDEKTKSRGVDFRFGLRFMF